MKLNLRFIITLILIVLIIISLIFIILEILYFNSNADALQLENSGILKNKKDLSLGMKPEIKRIGPLPGELAADTQYYRYGSLIIHVLTIVSGAYLLYIN